MTTNAGAADMARESIGFGAATREDAQEDAVKKMFTPEFRNRLDAIVPFSYLPPAVVARVVDKFILQLELQLADRNVHIELDDEAREWLTTRGYDKLYGARPMARLVQEKIKQPLAEELLFGKLVNGGEVKVRIKDNAPGLRDRPRPAQAEQGEGKERRRREEESQRRRSGGGVAQFVIPALIRDPPSLQCEEKWQVPAQGRDDVGTSQSFDWISIFPCEPLAAGLMRMANGLPSFDLPITSSPETAAFTPFCLNWST